MIAASIMMGRALAPIETAIANWRAFIAARQSVERLSVVLAQVSTTAAAVQLPKPVCDLNVSQLTVAAPGSQVPIVSNVDFRLSAGEALGVIGPSGAGKTSLVRTLVGVWPPAKGSVCLDGAALSQWDSNLLGRHIGYVSQAVELFEGTIAENIARMSVEPDSEGIIQAARAAGAHDFILGLSKEGYATKIGEAGASLSAGQRQRIAFARALYGNPFLVVLDEPSSNLDAEGEAALQKSLRGLKAAGSIIILIAHRPSALAICDKVLYLAKGTQQDFGLKENVLPKVVGRSPAASVIPASLKVVRDTTSGNNR